MRKSKRLARSLVRPDTNKVKIIIIIITKQKNADWLDYWSGHGRTNRTFCYGPVNTMHVCIDATRTCVYPKNMAFGQVGTNIVGHVDTVWGMKQVYIRATLKSKYVTVYGFNSWDSLQFNIRNPVMLPRFKK